jgi:APA family basic amino acid/polyamine antiporter
MERRSISALTATLLVVASMVGSGAFTTTGMLMVDLKSSVAALLVWLLGGLIALAGALSYAELVAALPRNGGEYQLLSRVYHPAVGFVAGWVSLVVGFSAPVAAASIAFGDYLQAVLPGVNKVTAGLMLITLLSVLHAGRVSLGSGVQNAFTLAKVAVVLAFIFGGLTVGDVGLLLPTEGMTQALGEVLSPGFAVGLIFVSFAYSGWNGAAYLAGEIKDPDKSLPRALAAGTGLVVLLYLGLNAVFLMSGSRESLAGVIEVGHVAAVGLFGERAGGVLSGVIALLLVSSVSAMIMTGPRVYQAVGEDYHALAFLRAQRNGQGPVAAVTLQAVVAVMMLLTASFDALLTYIGFTLSIFAGLTVFGVFYLRRREPALVRPYRVWGYPWTPITFIGLSAWMVVYTLVDKPAVAFAGLLTVLTGLGLYGWVRWRQDRAEARPEPRVEAQVEPRVEAASERAKKTAADQVVERSLVCDSAAD